MLTDERLSRLWVNLVAFDNLRQHSHCVTSVSQLDYKIGVGRQLSIELERTLKPFSI